MIPKAPLPLRLMIPGDKDDERLDRALEDMAKDQWIDDFMTRLHCAIGVRRN
jgi:hypothetical protein